MSDKYADQIKKLLALSQSSNPHEAAIALKRAHKLMQKYKISPKELKSSAFTELSARFSRGINHQKITDLTAFIIKNLTSCCVIGKKNPKELLFIGDSSSLMQVKYIFTFLDRALVNAKKFYVKKLKEDKALNRQNSLRALKKHQLKIIKQLLKVKPSLQSSYIKHQADIYLIGYLQAISSSLITAEIALPPELTEYVNTKYPNLKTRHLRARQIRGEELSAFEQGLKDGEKLRINKAVYGTNKNNYLSLH